MAAAQTPSDTRIVPAEELKIVPLESLPPLVGDGMMKSADPIRLVPLDPPSPEQSRGVAGAPLQSADGALDNEVIEIPAWWLQESGQPIFATGKWISFDLGTLLADALTDSVRFSSVRLRQARAIAEVVQEKAAFDARWLIDSRSGRTSDPVGNTLATGGPNRLREFDWTTKFGVQRLTRQGAQWDVSQNFGLNDSNSLFFAPTNQGNSRLSISMSQPLLAGAGRFYNERLIVDAQLDANISWREIQQELQTRLSEIMLTYWQLVGARCQYLQQRDLIQRGERLSRIVASRAHYDTGYAERLRVDEQLNRRRDQLLQLENQLRNDQTRLAMFVGTEHLANGGYQELIPRDEPRCIDLDIKLENAFTTGLNYRPEIAAGTTAIDQAAVQLRVRREELLPRLNAIVETYVAGLNGSFNVPNSVLDQFTEGEPGFTAGMVLDLPAGQRAARARHRAARVELAQLTAELQETIQRVRAEVEIAHRNLRNSAKLINTRVRTLAVAVKQEDYLARRWEMLGGEGNPAALVLADLLDVQEQRTNAEAQLVSAQVEYMQSLVRLQLAMGTLLNESSSIAPSEIDEGFFIDESTSGENQ